MDARPYRAPVTTYCAPCIADLALVREAVTSVAGTASCMAHVVLLTHGTDDPGRRRQRLDALKDLANGKAENAEPAEVAALELLVQEYGLASAMDMGGPSRRQGRGQQGQGQGQHGGEHTPRHGGPAGEERRPKSRRGRQRPGDRPAGDRPAGEGQDGGRRRPEGEGAAVTADAGAEGSTASSSSASTSSAASDAAQGSTAAPAPSAPESAAAESSSGSEATSAPSAPAAPSGPVSSGSSDAPAERPSGSDGGTTAPPSSAPDA